MTRAILFLALAMLATELMAHSNTIGCLNGLAVNTCCMGYKPITAIKYMFQDVCCASIQQSISCNSIHAADLCTWFVVVPHVTWS